MRGSFQTTTRLLAGCLAGVACSHGPTGDWSAVQAEDESGDVSVASGILEIDRDGETLMRVDYGGEGASGEIHATGRAEISDTSASLSLVGDGDLSAVTGLCTMPSDVDLVCDLTVGVAGLTLTWIREDGSLD